MSARPVRTRFAPSPTGYMHIGGMRTALFNWLWARRQGGQFILRIDDTDQQRNLAAALQPILDAFRWLGLNWDEGPEIGGPFAPYFQSQRGDLYQAAARRLLDTGRAYRDFDSPEVIKADREAAEREKRPYLNIRRSLDLSPAEISERIAAGAPHVIRLVVPRDQQVALQDHVRGAVSWDCSLIADPVILRSDGSPLYNFATVVDDVQLQISHVIRAEEHLTNTAVQLLIYRALDAEPPEFAHIPFVAAPGSTRKLSKRELAKYRTNPQFKKLFDIADRVLPAVGLASDDSLNPVMVSFYREVGFLPEAVLNALARLGWSLDDRTENMSLEFVARNFTLDRVVKGSASLDPDKLLAYQEYWMTQRSIEDRAAGCLEFLMRAGRIAAPPSDEMRAFVARLVSALGERIKLFSDVLAYDEYFTSDENLTYDEKAFEKRLRAPAGAAALLRDYRGELAGASEFTAAALEPQFQAFMTARGLPPADLIHALRIAVTGKPAGPGVFDALALLGRESCLHRIDRALSRVAAAG